MFGRRASDAALGNHYRRERIGSVDGQYFFSTREGTLEGPYRTRVDAERAITLYIDHMKQAESDPPGSVSVSFVSAPAPIFAFGQGMIGHSK